MNVGWVGTARPLPRGKRHRKAGLQSQLGSQPASQPARQSAWLAGCWLAGYSYSIVGSYHLQLYGTAVLHVDLDLHACSTRRSTSHRRGTCRVLQYLDLLVYAYVLICRQAARQAAGSQPASSQPASSQPPAGRQPAASQPASSQPAS